jgi:hypothetical protein
MDLGEWLRSLGLERYETTFRVNEIDETILPNLTAEDLKELGVGALGRRRRLLDAIAALRADGKKASSALPWRLLPSTVGTVSTWPSIRQLGATSHPSCAKPAERQ